MRHAACGACGAKPNSTQAGFESSLSRFAFVINSFCLILCSLLLPPLSIIPCHQPSNVPLAALSTTLDTFQRFPCCMARSNLCKMLFFFCNSPRVFVRYLFAIFEASARRYFSFLANFDTYGQLTSWLLASLGWQVDGQVFVWLSLPPLLISLAKCYSVAGL